MKITVYGATGDVGRRIVAEAVKRGHLVTAVSRSKTQLATLPEAVIGHPADVSDDQQLAKTTDGQDLLISALRPGDGGEEQLVSLTTRVIEAGENLGIRSIVVGGAARLIVPGQGGLTVLQSPDLLPEAAVPIARACQRQYEACLQRDQALWTYLSPPALLEPGERTGNYRLGLDTLIIDHNGHARISMEDFAVAILDEAESPTHTGKAFTVGY
ncbi:NAD(P)H-binding protein [Marinobacter sp. CHS3-4]|uniref:NAD(P)-dependent oxidoreductase n=1 Tax=Marinobacter sp. CHS3-4 TaxID=3045174 RepID=UPI0024B5B71F|nr:NAD(P)H-binding protein [Marinobacter sp. CHS3-4]MDI9246432.1 NAD(P)H-binding protein [Marinobacter sp. CHS3-4]